MDEEAMGDVGAKGRDQRPWRECMREEIVTEERGKKLRDLAEEVHQRRHFRNEIDGKRVFFFEGGKRVC